MHLVLYHVTELEHVCHADSGRLVEAETCLAVVEVCAAEAWECSLVCPLAEILEVSTVEDRSGELDAELLSCSTEHSLEDLSDVHT